MIYTLTGFSTRLAAANIRYIGFLRAGQPGCSSSGDPLGLRRSLVRLSGEGFVGVREYG